jgi:hypothetical protein
MTDQTTPQTAKKKLTNTQVALLVGGGLLLAYALYRAHKDNAASSQTQTAPSGATPGSAVGSESNPYFGDETDDLGSGGGGGGGIMSDTGDDTTVSGTPVFQPPPTDTTVSGTPVFQPPPTGITVQPDNPNPALSNLPTAPEIATAEAVNVGTGAEGTVATSPGAVTTFSSSAPATVVVGGEPTAEDIAAAEGYATPSKKAASHAAKTIPVHKTIPVQVRK